MGKGKMERMWLSVFVMLIVHLQSSARLTRGCLRRTAHTYKMQCTADLRLSSLSFSFPHFSLPPLSSHSLGSQFIEAKESNVFRATLMILATNWELDLLGFSSSSPNM